MLGPLMFTAGETPVAGTPDVNIVSKVGQRRPPRSVFNTATSYVERLPAFGALRSVMLSSVGGDTLFSDQILAAAELRHWAVEWLANQTIVHVTTAADGTVEQAVHPLLQRHPATNAATLFLLTLARCTDLERDRARTIAPDHLLVVWLQHLRVTARPPSLTRGRHFELGPPRDDVTPSSQPQASASDPFPDINLLTIGLQGLIIVESHHCFLM